MQTTISITNKWQIHIPIATRKTFGIDKPGMVNIKAKRGEIVITPQKKNILDYAGKYHYLLNKNTKKINLDKIRDHIDYSDL